MDALYDFLPAPPSNTDENSQRLYPRIVSKGTVTFEKLTEKIANHSGLSKGTILAVMDEIEYWTSQLLSDGYRVQIGNIGTASVSLKANTEVYDPQNTAHGFEEIRKTMLWERAPCTCRAKNPTESEGVFRRGKAEPPPIVFGRPCIYHPENIRRADRTSQNHRLA